MKELEKPTLFCIFVKSTKFMKEYNVIDNVFGLSTAQNEIFDVSCSAGLLDKVREKIENKYKNKDFDKDWDFEDEDFPLKIVEIEFNKNNVYFNESTIFN